MRRQDISPNRADSSPPGLHVTVNPINPDPEYKRSPLRLMCRLLDSRVQPLNDLVFMLIIAGESTTLIVMTKQLRHVSWDSWASCPLRYRERQGDV